MKIMFLRESEGVYRFGQKRVYIKVEKGNQIYVRVGGGYLHIDEFIDLYTKQEVAILERHNVAQNFQIKTMVQNIANQLGIPTREKSPIRSQERPKHD